MVIVSPPSSGDDFQNEWVILLHGLARSKSSMSRMEKHLTQEGFSVLNVDYPSRKKNIQQLVQDHLPIAINTCRQHGATTIHFVTHSMGGILVRYYLKHYHLKELGHVVMLSPPNAGSEVVDIFKSFFFFKWLNGPSGQQLGTGAGSIPIELGKINFQPGIITGDRSINLILSWIIPGPDDGKVSIERAKVNGMRDFRVIHATHPFIMKNREAIELTLKFLKSGAF
ncbi:MAG: alpha/beta hydrolase [Candidatus Magnetomorum sp.]|nr:alpha/beta hydrolase [Candidatus Magnetomorum sp.]